MLMAQGQMNEIYDAVIVGGGPAGLNAALVLGRCRRKVLVYDTGRYRNQRSRSLHCFLSRDGIAPGQLLTLSREQLHPYNTIEFSRAEVGRVECQPEGFAIDGNGENRVQSRAVLIATGVVDELPKIQGIADFFGRSVHVCPYCDGWEHRDAPIAAFGQGEKGVGLALMLQQWTQDIVLCTNNNGEISRLERAKLHESGIALCTKKIARLEGENGCLRRIVFADGTILPRHALFFNTGQHPRSKLLEQIGCRFDGMGVVCGEDGLTSIPGLYVAGDVSRDAQLAIVAAAEGARAALAINRALT
jgi:thioredoxin reductase